MPLLESPTVEFARVNDPLQYDMGQWALTVLGGLLVGTLAGVSIILGWARHSKDQLDTRITEEHNDTKKQLGVMQVDYDRRYDKIEQQFRDVWKALIDHSVELSTIKTTQEHGKDLLMELKEEGREQNKKLDIILQMRVSKS